VEQGKVKTLPENDLRGITRESSRCLTTVNIRMGEWWDRDTDQRWLTFGQAQLRRFGDNAFPWWWLGAYLAEGATDFEHDSGYALRLPLVSLDFQFMMNHGSHFLALVHPAAADEFRVPTPGYNPLEHPKTEPCPTCKGEQAHLMVPEGLYVPPFEPELYEVVKGRPVSIHIGTVYP
jgi:hypothetical protein